MQDLSPLHKSKQHVHQIVHAVEQAIALIEPSVPVLEDYPSQEVLQALKTMPGMDMQAETNGLHQFVENLVQNLFTIQVLGKFKNGKSTLLNAMLGAKFLPARTWPTTAVITTIIYGRRKDVAIYRHNIAEPEYISLEQFFADYQLKVDDQKRDERGKKTDQVNLDRFADIDFAQIESEHPLCAAHVRLVDSPGLGEHEFRSNKSTAFLHSTQAVVYVLNAIAILEERDTQIIDEHLGEGRLEHVFFVINRVNQIDQDDIPGVQDWVREKLEKHFLRHDNSFDEEFYRRRVFFVDAKSALDMALGTDSDGLSHEQIERRLQQTNVPAFVKSLYAFLTSSDERIYALYGSTQMLLQKTQAQLHQRAIRHSAALKRDLDGLLRSEKEATIALNKLEEQYQDLERKIMDEGYIVASELHSTFSQFIHEFKREIERHPFSVPGIHSQDLVQAMANKEQSAKLQAAIREAIEKYLQERFNAWFSGQRKTLDTKMSDSEKRINTEIKALMQGIDDVQSMLAGVVEPKATILSDNPFTVTSIANEVAYGQENWGVVILQSSQGIAKLLTRYAWGPGLYAKVDGFVRPLFEVVDKYLDKSIVESRNRKHLQQFHSFVIEEMQKALRDDVGHPNLFTSGHVRDLRLLAQQILNASDPLGRYLRGRLSDAAQAALKRAETADRPQKDDFQEITNFLNSIVNGELIYTPERFAHIHLDDEIHYVLKQPDHNRRTLDLNRWLLSRAYPSAIAEKLRDTINLRLAFEFRQFAKQVTNPIQKKLEQTRMDKDRIVKQRTTRQPSTEQELERLRWLENEFNGIVHHIARLAGEKQL